MAEGGIRLFVYGTLLRGESSHHLLQDRSRFLGETSTVPGYRLVDLGSYPGMVIGGEGVVAGEVFEVDDLTLGTIDHFEGHPHLYQRSTIRLANRLEAVGYLLPPKAAGVYPPIPQGSWREFR